MTDQEAIASAATFLAARRISFEPPGRAMLSAHQAIEVVFNVPMPPGTAVMDPPDVRVRVSTTGGPCELVEQM